MEKLGNPSHVEFSPKTVRRRGGGKMRESKDGKCISAPKENKSAAPNAFIMFVYKRSGLFFGSCMGRFERLQNIRSVPYPHNPWIRQGETNPRQNEN